jgi:hypothetical protein
VTLGHVLAHPLQEAQHEGRQEDISRRLDRFPGHPVDDDLRDSVHEGRRSVLTAIDLLVEFQALLDERVCLDVFASFLVIFDISSHEAIVSAVGCIPEYLVVRHVIEHLEEKREARLALFVVRDVLVEDADLLVFDEMGVGLRQLLVDSLAEGGGDLHDCVLQLRQEFPVEVAEEVKDGLHGCARAGAGLDYSDFGLGADRRVEALVCGFEVAGDGHAVVGFEYFAGSEPGVGRVLLGQFLLVVVVADEAFEVDGGLEFSHLEVWLGRGGTRFAEVAVGGVVEAVEDVVAEGHQSAHRL